jgi:hypothetical protein
MLNRVHLCGGHLPAVLLHVNVGLLRADRAIGVFLQSGLDFSAKSVPFCAFIYDDTVRSR